MTMVIDIKKEIEDELESIIINEDIYPVYQPIVSLKNGSVLGYEALSRINRISLFNNIEELFVTAGKSGILWKLEQVCRRAALKGIFAQKNIFEQENAKLFINVSPKILHDEKFKTGFTREYIGRYGIDSKSIIFEVTEKERVEQEGELEQAVSHYKEQDYQIAIDDMGSGYSNLNLICSLSPHYIKLDIRLIRDIHKNPTQYAIVKGMAECSLNSGIQLIAEGIESEKDMEVLIDLGIQYGQGYYLGCPERKLRQPNKELCTQITEIYQKKHNKNYFGKNNFYVKNIVTTALTVPPEMKVSKILEYLDRNTNAAGICVLEHNQIKGVLTREKLMKQLSGRYGFSLHQNKPILEMCEKNFLKVEAGASISSVAKIAMERESENLYDFIVVNEDNDYLGIVTVRSLLQKAMEIDVDMAKAANPLTGLPGNIVIEQEIIRCVKEQDFYSIYYLDLDNFKAYNDTYGFEKGDEAIRLLGEILKDRTSEDGFVGHIGGDDFVMICYNYQDDDYADEIRTEFECRARELYGEEDRKKGYILSKNRHGDMECFPLLSVTIVCVSNKNRDYDSQDEILDILAKRKKEEKCRKSLVLAG